MNLSVPDPRLGRPNPFLSQLHSDKVFACPVTHARQPEYVQWPLVFDQSDLNRESDAKLAPKKNASDQFLPPANISNRRTPCISLVFLWTLSGISLASLWYLSGIFLIANSFMINNLRRSPPLSHYPIPPSPDPRQSKKSYRVCGLVYIYFYIKKAKEQRKTNIGPQNSDRPGGPTDPHAWWEREGGRANPFRINNLAGKKIPETIQRHTRD